MMTEIKVPALGESVTEATIGQWFKKEGEAVKADEPVVELETDKVTVEVPAPTAGVLQKIAVQPGETVNVGAVLGAIADGAAAAAAAPSEPAKAAAAPRPATPAAPPREKPAATAAAQPSSPAVRKIAEERRIDVSSLTGTGKDGRLTKGDLLDASDGAPKVQAKAPAPSPAPTPSPASTPQPPPLRE